jgi:hypothetical protein
MLNFTVVILYVSLSNWFVCWVIKYFLIFHSWIFRNSSCLDFRGGPFDFWGGGGGWKISKKNFLQSKEKEKKSCSIQSRKKKRIPTCMLIYWRCSLQYCVPRFARFCIFEQAHLLKRTRGEQWTTSQGFYRLWTLGKIVAPPEKIWA